MRYGSLLALVSLASFVVAGAAGALVVRLAWPRIRTWLAVRSPAVQTRALIAVRLVPTALGALAAVSTIVAFLRHEPRQTSEQPGLALALVAALGATLVLASAWRVLRIMWGTSRFVRAIARVGAPLRMRGIDLDGWSVETPLPLAGIAGALRPRLIVSERVLRECPPDEIAAVLGHEQAHRRRYDNLVAALFAVLPDLLVGTALGREAARLWSDAAEDAADDEATADDPGLRVALASALVRVARMAPIDPPAGVLMTTFYRGDRLEGRVRRLIDARAIDARPEAGARIWHGLPSIALITWALTSDSASLAAHQLIEWAVRILP